MINHCCENSRKENCILKTSVRYLLYDWCSETIGSKNIKVCVLAFYSYCNNRANKLENSNSVTLTKHFFRMEGENTVPSLCNVKKGQDITNSEQVVCSTNRPSCNNSTCNKQSTTERSEGLAQNDISRSYGEKSKSNPDTSRKTDKSSCNAEKVSQQDKGSTSSFTPDLNTESSAKSPKMTKMFQILIDLDRKEQERKNKRRIPDPNLCANDPKPTNTVPHPHFKPPTKIKSEIELPPSDNKWCRPNNRSYNPKYPYCNRFKYSRDKKNRNYYKNDFTSNRSNNYYWNYRNSHGPQETYHDIGFHENNRCTRNDHPAPFYSRFHKRVPSYSSMNDSNNFKLKDDRGEQPSNPCSNQELEQTSRIHLTDNKSKEFNSFPDLELINSCSVAKVEMSRSSSASNLDIANKMTNKNVNTFSRANTIECLHATGSIDDKNVNVGAKAKNISINVNNDDSCDNKIKASVGGSEVCRRVAELDISPNVTDLLSSKSITVEPNNEISTRLNVTDVVSVTSSKQVHNNEPNSSPHARDIFPPLSSTVDTNDQIKSASVVTNSEHNTGTRVIDVPSSKSSTVDHNNEFDTSVKNTDIPSYKSDVIDPNSEPNTSLHITDHIAPTSATLDSEWEQNKGNQKSSNRVPYFMLGKWNKLINEGSNSKNNEMEFENGISINKKVGNFWNKACETNKDKNMSNENNYFNNEKRTDAETAKSSSTKCIADFSMEHNIDTAVTSQEDSEKSKIESEKLKTSNSCTDIGHESLLINDERKPSPNQTPSLQCKDECQVSDDSSSATDPEPSQNSSVTEVLVSRSYDDDDDSFSTSKNGSPQISHAVVNLKSSNFKQPVENDQSSHSKGLEESEEMGFESVTNQVNNFAYDVTSLSDEKNDSLEKCSENSQIIEKCENDKDPTCGIKKKDEENVLQNNTNNIVMSDELITTKCSETLQYDDNINEPEVPNTKHPSHSGCSHSTKVPISNIERRSNVHENNLPHNAKNVNLLSQEKENCANECQKETITSVFWENLTTKSKFQTNSSEVLGNASVVNESASSESVDISTPCNFTYEQLNTHNIEDHNSVIDISDNEQKSKTHQKPSNPNCENIVQISNHEFLNMNFQDMSSNENVVENEGNYIISPVFDYSSEVTISSSEVDESHSEVPHNKEQNDENVAVHTRTSQDSDFEENTRSIREELVDRSCHKEMNEKCSSHKNVRINKAAKIKIKLDNKQSERLTSQSSKNERTIFEKNRIRRIRDSTDQEDSFQFSFPDNLCPNPSEVHCKTSDLKCASKIDSRTELNQPETFASDYLRSPHHATGESASDEDDDAPTYQASAEFKRNLNAKPKSPRKTRSTARTTDRIEDDATLESSEETVMISKQRRTSASSRQKNVPPRKYSLRSGGKIPRSPKKEDRKQSVQFEKYSDIPTQQFFSKNPAVPLVRLEDSLNVKASNILSSQNCFAIDSIEYDTDSNTDELKTVPIRHKGRKPYQSKMKTDTPSNTKDLKIVLSLTKDKSNNYSSSIRLKAPRDSESKENKLKIDDVIKDKEDNCSPISGTKSTACSPPFLYSPFTSPKSNDDILNKLKSPSDSLPDIDFSPSKNLEYLSSEGFEITLKSELQRVIEKQHEKSKQVLKAKPGRLTGVSRSHESYTEELKKKASRTKKRLNSIHRCYNISKSNKYKLRSKKMKSPLYKIEKSCKENILNRVYLKRVSKRQKQRKCFKSVESEVSSGLFHNSTEDNDAENELNMLPEITGNSTNGATPSNVIKSPNNKNIDGACSAQEKTVVESASSTLKHKLKNDKSSTSINSFKNNANLEELLAPCDFLKLVAPESATSSKNEISKSCNNKGRLSSEFLANEDEAQLNVAKSSNLHENLGSGENLDNSSSKSDISVPDLNELCHHDEISQSDCLDNIETNKMESKTDCEFTKKVFLSVESKISENTVKYGNNKEKNGANTDKTALLNCVHKGTILPATDKLSSFVNMNSASENASDNEIILSQSVNSEVKISESSSKKKEDVRIIVSNIDEILDDLEKDAIYSQNESFHKEKEPVPSSETMPQLGDSPNASDYQDTQQGPSTVQKDTTSTGASIVHAVSSKANLKGSPIKLKKANKILPSTTAANSTVKVDGNQSSQHAAISPKKRKTKTEPKANKKERKLKRQLSTAKEEKAQKFDTDHTIENRLSCEFPKFNWLEKKIKNQTSVEDVCTAQTSPTKLRTIACKDSSSKRGLKALQLIQTPVKPGVAGSITTAKGNRQTLPKNIPKGKNLKALANCSSEDLVSGSKFHTSIAPSTGADAVIATPLTSVLNVISSETNSVISGHGGSRVLSTPPTTLSGLGSSAHSFTIGVRNSQASNSPPVPKTQTDDLEHVNRNLAHFKSGGHLQTVVSPGVYGTANRSKAIPKVLPQSSSQQPPYQLSIPQTPPLVPASSHVYPPYPQQHGQQYHQGAQYRPQASQMEHYTQYRTNPPNYDHSHNRTQLTAPYEQTQPTGYHHVYQNQVPRYSNEGGQLKRIQPASVRPLQHNQLDRQVIYGTHSHQGGQQHHQVQQRNIRPFPTKSTQGQVNNHPDRVGQSPQTSFLNRKTSSTNQHEISSNDTTAFLQLPPDHSRRIVYQYPEQYNNSHFTQSANHLHDNNPEKSASTDGRKVRQVTKAIPNLCPISEILKVQSHLLNYYTAESPGCNNPQNTSSVQPTWINTSKTFSNDYHVSVDSKSPIIPASNVDEITKGIADNSSPSTNEGVSGSISSTNPMNAHTNFAGESQVSTIVTTSSSTSLATTALPSSTITVGLTISGPPAMTASVPSISNPNQTQDCEQTSSNQSYLRTMVELFRKRMENTNRECLVTKPKENERSYHFNEDDNCTRQASLGLTSNEHHESVTFSNNNEVEKKSSLETVQDQILAINDESVNVRNLEDDKIVESDATVISVKENERNIDNQQDLGLAVSTLRSHITGSSSELLDKSTPEYKQDAPLDTSNKLISTEVNNQDDYCSLKRDNSHPDTIDTSSISEQDKKILLEAQPSASNNSEQDRVSNNTELEGNDSDKSPSVFNGTCPIVNATEENQKAIKSEDASQILSTDLIISGGKTDIDLPHESSNSLSTSFKNVGTNESSDTAVTRNRLDESKNLVGNIDRTPDKLESVHESEDALKCDVHGIIGDSKTDPGDHLQLCEKESGKTSSNSAELNNCNNEKSNKLLKKQKNNDQRHIRKLKTNCRVLKTRNKRNVSKIELLKEELDRTRREVEELRIRQDKFLKQPPIMLGLGLEHLQQSYPPDFILKNTSFEFTKKLHSEDVITNDYNRKAEVKAECGPPKEEKTSNASGEDDLQEQKEMLPPHKKKDITFENSENITEKLVQQVNQNHPSFINEDSRKQNKSVSQAVGEDGNSYITSKNVFAPEIEQLTESDNNNQETNNSVLSKKSKDERIQGSLDENVIDSECHHQEQDRRNSGNEVKIEHLHVNQEVNNKVSENHNNKDEAPVHISPVNKKNVATNVEQIESDPKSKQASVNEKNEHNEREHNAEARIIANFSSEPLNATTRNENPTRCETEESSEHISNTAMDIRIENRSSNSNDNLSPQISKSIHSQEFRQDELPEYIDSSTSMTTECRNNLAQSQNEEKNIDRGGETSSMSDTISSPKLQVPSEKLPQKETERPVVTSSPSVLPKNDVPAAFENLIKFNPDLEIVPIAVKNSDRDSTPERPISKQIKDLNTRLPNSNIPIKKRSILLWETVSSSASSTSSSSSTQDKYDGSASHQSIIKQPSFSNDDQDSSVKSMLSETEITLVHSKLSKPVSTGSVIDKTSYPATSTSELYRQRIFDNDDAAEIIVTREKSERNTNEQPASKSPSQSDNVSQTATRRNIPDNYSTNSYYGGTIDDSHDRSQYNKDPVILKHVLSGRPSHSGTHNISTSAEHGRISNLKSNRSTEIQRSRSLSETSNNNSPSPLTKQSMLNSQVIRHSPGQSPTSRSTSTCSPQQSIQRPHSGGLLHIHNVQNLAGDRVRSVVQTPPNNHLQLYPVHHAVHIPRHEQRHGISPHDAHTPQVSTVEQRKEHERFPVIDNHLGRGEKRKISEPLPYDLTKHRKPRDANIGHGLNLVGHSATEYPSQLFYHQNSSVVPALHHSIASTSKRHPIQPKPIHPLRPRATYAPHQIHVQSQLPEQTGSLKPHVSPTGSSSHVPPQLPNLYQESNPANLPHYAAHHRLNLAHYLEQQHKYKSEIDRLYYPMTYPKSGQMSTSRPPSQQLHQSVVPRPPNVGPSTVAPPPDSYRAPIMAHHHSSPNVAGIPAEALRYVIHQDHGRLHPGYPTHHGQYPNSLEQFRFPRNDPRISSVSSKQEELGGSSLNAHRKTSS